jgi:hypothetical protein
VKEARPSLRVTIISDKTYGPRRVLPIQELLSKNSFAARTMCCDSYRSRFPGRQLCRCGITRQRLPSTFSKMAARRYTNIMDAN